MLQCVAHAFSGIGRVVLVHASEMKLSSTPLVSCAPRRFPSGRALCERRARGWCFGIWIEVDAKSVCPNLSQPAIAVFAASGVEFAWRNIVRAGSRNGE